MPDDVFEFDPGPGLDFYDVTMPPPPQAALNIIQAGRRGGRSALRDLVWQEIPTAQQRIQFNGTGLSSGFWDRVTRATAAEDTTVQVEETAEDE